MGCYQPAYFEPDAVFAFPGTIPPAITWKTDPGSPGAPPQLMNRCAVVSTDTLSHTTARYLSTVHRLSRAQSYPHTHEVSTSVKTRGTAAITLSVPGIRRLAAGCTRPCGTEMSTRHAGPVAVSATW
eukprot:381773-Rhodomonas_salina.1